ncbi:MAG: hypothetical protein IKK21_03840 [Clostridia bacterium]|nr:hypothetical protein [Clostridia bacterium]
MNRHFQPFPPMPPCLPEPCPPPMPSCPPETCRCGHCRRPDTPCKPFPPSTFLLPKVQASGRVWLRQTPFCLKLTDVDPCAQPPYTLLSVDAGSAPSRWVVRPGASHRQLCVHLWIPLCCRLRDGCGNTFTAAAEIEADVPLRLTMPLHECWRSTLVALPCVRLVCAPPPADTLCITAQLEIIAEVYLTRWETCMAGVPKPVSPGCP